MRTAAKKPIKFYFFLLFSIACVNGCGNSDNGASNSHTVKITEHGNMVYIPAGPFQMGSDDKEAKKDEKPRHTVVLDAFYIDIHEVSNLRYKAFIDATGHPAPYVDAQWAEPFNWKGATFPEDKGDYPVVLVSWHDAVRFAEWAGKRLPTEAEWEKAARSGLVNKTYPYGDDIKFEHASYFKGYIRGKKMYPIGKHEPNAFGLYDMAGNVWEWCRDWYGEEYYSKSPEKNPQGPPEGFYRVYRGGSWINDVKYLRCAYRGKNTPDYQSHTVGFRCALSAK